MLVSLKHDAARGSAWVLRVCCLYFFLGKKIMRTIIVNVFLRSPSMRFVIRTVAISLLAGWLAACSEAPKEPEVVVYTSRKDRKSTRLNSSHVRISYAVFCLKKKKKKKNNNKDLK